MTPTCVQLTGSQLSFEGKGLNQLWAGQALLAVPHLRRVMVSVDRERGSTLTLVQRGFRGKSGLFRRRGGRERRPGGAEIGVDLLLQGRP